MSKLQPLTSNAIRSRFLSFFQSKNHLLLPSSSLIPINDSSLLFTNAGMVQFKDIFMNISNPHHYKRITTSQRCLRAGGKHNDLDNVGYTSRHHTLFEMLGNFSFQDYKKEEAIEMAWTFMTDKSYGLGISRDLLAVSVLEGDKETAEIWKKIAGLKNDKIMICGKADNFWSMGEVGPCGPCTEIFFDQGKEVDGNRWLELWNVVFMQYEANKAGQLLPLPALSVDTGMGIERVAAVLQNKPTNFDSDIFQPIVNKAFDVFDLAGSVKDVCISMQTLPLEQKTALKIVVDHLRAACCMIGDGIIPGGQGRGYVLRRIIRRAVRYSSKLQVGKQNPMLFSLLPVTIASLIPVFPTITERLDTISTVLKVEEENFLSTLKRGEAVLLLALQSSTSKIDAKTVFDMYDRYGFPMDLTAIICKEYNREIDEEGFNKLLDKQREISRQSWTGVGESIPGAVKSFTCTNSVAYDVPKNMNSNNEASWTTSCVVKESFNHADKLWVSLDPSPFYAKGGGQVGDIGTLNINGIIVPVLDCIKPNEFSSVVILPSVHDPIFNNSSESVNSIDVSSLIHPGSSVLATVDSNHRIQVSIHHSATHLLHSSLKKVLGNHVNQAGSSVDSSRLRFDYTSSVAPTPSQLIEIEDSINSIARNGKNVETFYSNFNDAINKHKATALFSEKYGSNVRVVKMESSTELCGGTHVNNLINLYPIAIISDTTIGAGIRRIEAIAGTAAIPFFIDNTRILRKIAENLSVNLNQVESKVIKSDKKTTLKILNQKSFKIRSIDASVFMLDASDIDVEKDKKGINRLLQLGIDTTKEPSVQLFVAKDRLAIISKSKEVQANSIASILVENFGGFSGGKPHQAQATLSKPFTIEEIVLLL